MRDRTTESKGTDPTIVAVDAITIRPATAGDRDALRRLAILDSATVPVGDLLVADGGGELRAAVAIGSGKAIADPFHPTAGIVVLLRARARQIATAERASCRAAGARSCGACASWAELARRLPARRPADACRPPARACGPAAPRRGPAIRRGRRRSGRR